MNDLHAAFEAWWATRKPNGESVAFQSYKAGYEAGMSARSERWCRECGVYHDPEVGETCPKALPQSER